MLLCYLVCMTALIKWHCSVGVQDTNEGAPAFSLANYIATVDENLAAGALVVVVREF